MSTHKVRASNKVYTSDLILLLRIIYTIKNDTPIITGGNRICVNIGGFGWENENEWQIFSYLGPPPEMT